MRTMQRAVLSSKNKIALFNGLLIASGFLVKWTSSFTLYTKWALIAASVLGLLPILIQAWQALRVRVISIDLLVTVAVGGAFAIQNYEESAIVTFLFLFGAFLEQRTLNRTRSAIKALTEMAPQTAWKQGEDGEFLEVDIDEVEIGDVLLVKTGSRVPVDGRVLSGQASVDESSISGESIPLAKEEGSPVFAGTILDNGTLQIVAERVGQDTTFGRIIELVEEAQDSKSKAERFIDRFSKYYTPAVLLLALIVFAFTRKVELAVTILVLGCPGALVIGVPVSNVAGIGNGASHGILIKGSEVISDFARLDRMIFDKTGTLTLGNPSVSAKAFYGEDTDKALVFLASIERESDHPLARAVLEEIGPVDYLEVSETDVIKGSGILALIQGQRVAVGNRALMEDQGIPLPQEALDDLARFESKGYSLVMTAIDDQLKILMGIRDPIRPGVPSDLKRLRKLGVRDLVMLSGDNQGTVDVISRELGLEEAHGNLLPQDKSAYVKERIQEGEIVAFVGDGVNDSPSLALAQIGIAMGGGTEVAIETSDLVLINSDFSRLPHALGLAKAIVRNMVQNIVIAVGVVLALLASLIFGEWMNMSIGMLVHEGSILAVILNGMRLIRYKPRA